MTVEKVSFATQKNDLENRWWCAAVHVARQSHIRNRINSHCYYYGHPDNYWIQQYVGTGSREATELPKEHDSSAQYVLLDGNIPGAKNNILLIATHQTRYGLSTVPQKLIDLLGLGSIVDLSGIPEFNRYEVPYLLETGDKKGQLTYNLQIETGQHASVSFFDNSLAGKIQEKLSTKKIKVVELKALISATDAEWGVTQIYAKQVVARSRFFLYTSLINIVQNDLTVKPTQIIRLGTFIPLGKIIEKPNSFARLSQSLVTTLYHQESIPILTGEDFVAERPDLFQYWCRLKAVNKQYLVNLPVVARPTFKSISESKFIEAKQAKEFTKLDEYKKYKNLLAAQKKSQDEVVRINSTITKESGVIQRIAGEIARLQKLIAKYNTETDQGKTLIATMEAQLKPQMSLVESLQETLAKSKLELDAAIQAKKSAEQTRDRWYETLKGRGYHIVDVVYLLNGRHISIEEDSAVHLDADAKLQSIVIRTDRPTKILLHGRGGKAVAGGPYKLRVQTEHGAPTLFVSPLNLSSIIGFPKDTNTPTRCVWHPHTDVLNFDPLQIPRTFSYEMPGCLGSAAPILHKAFSENDIIGVILGVTLWLEQADPADYWAARWPWFPDWEEVSPDGKYVEKLLTTKTEKKDIGAILDELAG